MADTVLKGGCLCGAVRYEIHGAAMVVGHCHCEHCRKSAGAGHTTIAAYAESAVKITGALTHYKIKADSGMMADRGFCPTCGSWITGNPESAPGVIAITVASLDDPETLAPQMRFFDKRRITWDTIDPALPAFAALPPQA